jgi:hypothetical protein
LSFPENRFPLNPDAPVTSSLEGIFFLSCPVESVLDGERHNKTTGQLSMGNEQGLFSAESQKLSSFLES